jgi:prepilin-type N-terminal cleavage/methylation domain-containing protein
MNLYKPKFKTKVARNNDSDSGFTLIEVVIAALILMAFVAISAQSILLSSYVRVKAQERSKANQAIQEDIEILRLIGSSNPNLSPNANRCAAENFASGYANDLQTAFFSMKASYASGYDAASFASEEFSFAQTSSFSQNNFNYKIRLRRRIESDSRDSSINYKALRIRYRAETTKKAADPNAFNNDCNYSNNCILDDYIEVIPNVALRCP